MDLNVIFIDQKHYLLTLDVTIFIYITTFVYGYTFYAHGKKSSNETLYQLSDEYPSVG